MISKEEILSKHKIGQTNNWLASTVERIEDAMSEHAEQMTIGFAEWIEIQIYTKGLNGKWYKIPGVPVGEKRYHTTSELYQLYLEYLKTL